ncbi:MAG: hypothetical protein ACOCPN_00555 [Desulfonatronovibrionaceae bacterium]
MNRVITIFFLLSLVFCAAWAFNLYAQDLDGKDLLELRCRSCHNLDRVNQADKDRKAWEKTINKMINIGASVEGQEKQAILDHLAP